MHRTSSLPPLLFSHLDNVILLSNQLIARLRIIRNRSRLSLNTSSSQINKLLQQAETDDNYTYLSSIQKLTETLEQQIQQHHTTISQVQTRSTRLQNTIQSLSSAHNNSWPFMQLPALYEQLQQAIQALESSYLEAKQLQSSLQNLKTQSIHRQQQAATKTCLQTSQQLIQQLQQLQQTINQGDALPETMGELLKHLTDIGHIQKNLQLLLQTDPPSPIGSPQL